MYVINGIVYADSEADSVTVKDAKSVTSAMPKSAAVPVLGMPLMPGGKLAGKANRSRLGNGLTYARTARSP